MDGCYVATGSLTGGRSCPLAPSAAVWCGLQWAKGQKIVLFILKKIVAVLTAPSAVAVLLALAAVAARALRRPKWMTGLLVSSVVVAYVSSIPIVSDALLRPLERTYSRLNESGPPPGVTRIVVLGTSYDPRADRPVTGALATEGVVRAVEGVRLFRVLRLQKLVLSGGRALSPEPSAQGYALLAKDLGVDPSAMVVLDQSDDTAEEARAIHELIGNEPFILVTSASHMPRSVRLMKAAGANPVPAPTAQRTGDASDDFSVLGFIPSATALHHTEMALHEYLGLIAIMMGAQ